MKDGVVQVEYQSSLIISFFNGNSKPSVFDYIVKLSVPEVFHSLPDYTWHRLETLAAGN